jgi:predicted AAA+ superfamily ATPase
MIRRLGQIREVAGLLQQQPVVANSGPRQVGKTTLAAADPRIARVSDPGDRGAMFAEVLDFALRILG